MTAKTMLAGCLAMSGSVAASEPQGRHTTGLFSSLEYNDQGGDLLGMEVYLVVGAKGQHVAIVQCAGGEAADPVTVRAAVDGSRVTFTLPSGLPECGRELSGVVTPQGLRGRFVGEATDRWLPRKKGYWE